VVWGRSKNARPTSDAVATDYAAPERRTLAVATDVPVHRATRDARDRTVAEMGTASTSSLTTAGGSLPIRSWPESTVVLLAFRFTESPLLC